MPLTKVSYSMIKGAPLNVLDFGAKGDGVTDDTAAIQLAMQNAYSNVIYFPAGTYLTSEPLLFNQPAFIVGEANNLTTIKLTADAPYVIGFNGTIVSLHMRGPQVSNIKLDGNGYADDGLYLKAVINGIFDSVNVTNVKVAGLHLAWAQVCTFDNYICSDREQPYTTVPINGILIDSADASSANTFTNITIESVSGAGVLAYSLINSVFINGTSESNDIGFQFGDVYFVGNAGCLGNTVIGVDMEENTTADILLEPESQNNQFYGISAGYNSPLSIHVNNSNYNSFFGGYSGRILVESSSYFNQFNNVTLQNAGTRIDDSGEFTTITNCTNAKDSGYIIPEQQVRRGQYYSPSGTYQQIDASITSSAFIKVNTASFEVVAPTKPVNGQFLTVTIINITGGAITTSWDSSAFKIAGWTNPASGKNRSALFSYNSDDSYWYAISMSQADVSN